jgi:hypothetical protein
MQNSIIKPDSQLVQPGLPALRGANDSAPGQPANRRISLGATQASGVGGLDGAWPLRARFTQVGQRPDGYCAANQSLWPGHTCGIRAPGEAETPLSFDEVAFARRHNLIG